MGWVRIDDAFHRNPKVIAAGRDGRALYIAGLCYCNGQLTDGVIPKDAVRVIAADAGVRPAAARHLIHAGLWVDRDDHYQVNDYLKYQPSRAKVEGERAREREKKQQQRRGSDGRYSTPLSPGDNAGDTGGGQRAPGPDRDRKGSSDNNKSRMDPDSGSRPHRISGESRDQHKQSMSPHMSPGDNAGDSPGESDRPIPIPIPISTSSTSDSTPDSSQQAAGGPATDEEPHHTTDTASTPELTASAAILRTVNHLLATTDKPIRNPGPWRETVNRDLTGRHYTTALERAHAGWTIDQIADGILDPHYRPANRQPVPVPPQLTAQQRAEAKRARARARAALPPKPDPSMDGTVDDPSTRPNSPDATPEGDPR